MRRDPKSLAGFPFHRRYGGLSMMPAAPRRATLAVISMLAILLSLGAQPGTSAPRSIDLVISIAEIMRLERPAATIVIGNPSIADASITDDRTMILTGRAAGVTNLIAIDAQGAEIANIELRVSPVGPNHLVVQDAGRRAIYLCTPACRPVEMVRLPAPTPSPPAASGVDPPNDGDEAPADDELFEDPEIEEMSP